MENEIKRIRCVRFHEKYDDDDEPQVMHKEIETKKKKVEPQSDVKVRVEPQNDVKENYPKVNGENIEIVENNNEKLNNRIGIQRG